MTAATLTLGAPAPLTSAAPLRLTSLLAANAEPHYLALASLLAGAPDETVTFLPAPDDALQVVRSAQVQLAALCGLLYVQHRAELLPLAAPVPAGSDVCGRAVYASAVVVRRDHPARRFGDLTGAAWVLNERASFSGYVALLAALEQRGLPLSVLGRPDFSGSHLASLAAVREGRAEATAVDSTVLALAFVQTPALSADLRVLTTFGPYPAPPIVAHRSLPGPRREAIRRTLTTLHHHRRGREVLALAGLTAYVPVTPRDYLPIREAARRAAALEAGPHD